MAKPASECDFIPASIEGVFVLQQDCELLYLHTGSYRPEAEGGVNPLDPQVAIRWPVEITRMSDRDRRHGFVTDDFTGVEL